MGNKKPRDFFYRPQPWANQIIHPWIEPPLEADPTRKFYWNNNTWRYFGFNLFLIYSTITFLGKNSRIHPFLLSLFFFRKAPQECEVVFFIFYYYPTKFFLPPTQLKSKHTRHYIYGVVKLHELFPLRSEVQLLNHNDSQTKIIFPTKVAPLCTVTHQILHFPTNQIANCNITMNSRTVYVDFIFLAH